MEPARAGCREFNYKGLTLLGAEETVYVIGRIGC